MSRKIICGNNQIKKVCTAMLLNPENKMNRLRKLFEPKIKELFVDNNDLTLWLLLDDALALL